MPPRLLRITFVCGAAALLLMGLRRTGILQWAGDPKWTPAAGTEIAVTLHGWTAGLDAVDSVLLTATLLSALVLVGLGAWHVMQPVFDGSHAGGATFGPAEIAIAAFGGVGAFAAHLLGAGGTAVVAALAATAATIGWMKQRETSLLISRKQHTLNVLMQLRQSDTWNQHRLNIMSVYPQGRVMKLDDVPALLAARMAPANYARDPTTGKNAFPLAESIIYVLNYNEYLSAAVKQGDIDDALLWDSLGEVMVQYFEKCRPLIEYYCRPGEDGLPSRDVYDNYWNLVRRWRADHRGEMQRRRFTPVDLDAIDRARERIVAGS